MGGNTAIDAYHLAEFGGRLLAASGQRGLGVFELLTAPIELRALPGSTPGTLNLDLAGPDATPVVVQRSADLKTWQDGQTVTLETSPVTVTVPGTGGREFFRIKKP